MKEERSFNIFFDVFGQRNVIVEANIGGIHFLVVEKVFLGELSEVKVRVIKRCEIIRT